MKLSNAEEFKQKLIDKNIKYKLVGEYTNSKIKTEFYCEEHDHIFLTKPNTVLQNKKSCEFCKTDMDCMTHTRESFNLLLKEKNIKYYIVGDYKSSKAITTFYCEEHGEFAAIPKLVLKESKKCPDCTGKIKIHTTETFNNRLKLNGVKYILISDYIDTKTESTFYCKEHGEFISTPQNILNGSNTCKLCRIAPPSNKWTLESLNKHLKENNRNLVFHEYIRVKTKSPCECKVCNNIWLVKPKNIVSGSGCPVCAKCTFNFNSPAILYYIKITHNDKIYYKIGITSRNVKTRFSGESVQIEILNEKKFNLGIDAYNEEQKILKQYENYRYCGEPILQTGGSTEMFTEDVLNFF